MAYRLLQSNYSGVGMARGQAAEGFAARSDEPAAVEKRFRLVMNDLQQTQFGRRVRWGRGDTTQVGHQTEVLHDKSATRTVRSILIRRLTVTFSYPGT